MNYDPDFHNVKPGQKCRILTIQIAVPAEADGDLVADELSAMLSGAIASENSNILDWGYVQPYGTEPVVTAPERVSENEIFQEVLTTVSVCPPAPTLPVGDEDWNGDTQALFEMLLDEALALEERME